MNICMHPDIAVDPVRDVMENDPNLVWTILGIVAAVAAITAVLIVILIKKKKKGGN